MNWKSLFNLKIVLATLVIFVGVNSSQCMTDANPECKKYCEDGVDTKIDDSKGKTGEVFKASEICCCSIYGKYPYSKIILALYYIPIIYLVLLVIQHLFSKIKPSDKK